MKWWVLALGIVCAFVGLALSAHSVVMLPRVDGQGYYESGWERIAVGSPGIALNEEHKVVVESGVRVHARPVDADREIFIGVGAAEDVDAYVSGARIHAVEVVDVDPTRLRTGSEQGTRPPGLPERETFWLASVRGSGEQELTWEPKSGDFRFVVMNPDTEPGFEAEVSVGYRLSFLERKPLLKDLGLGVFLIAIGAWMVVVALRDSS